MLVFNCLLATLATAFTVNMIREPPGCSHRVENGQLLLSRSNGKTIVVDLTKGIAQSPSSAGFIRPCSLHGKQAFEASFKPFTPESEVMERMNLPTDNSDNWLFKLQPNKIHAPNPIAKRETSTFLQVMNCRDPRVLVGGSVALGAGWLLARRYGYQLFYGWGLMMISIFTSISNIQNRNRDE